MRGLVPLLLPLFLLPSLLPASSAFVQTPLPSSSSSSSTTSSRRRHASSPGLLQAASSEDQPPPPSSKSTPQTPSPSTSPRTSRAAQGWGTMSRRGAMGVASALVPALLTMGVPTPGKQGVAQAALEEFPWVTKGGLLDGVLPESVLVESLPLNNQAIKGMGQALSRINELRGLNVLQGPGFCNEAGQVKADLSFVAPATPEATAAAAANGTTAAAAAETANSEDISTFRWSKIKGLAENVRATYNREKDAFPYALTIRPNTTAESQSRRRARFADELRLLDEAIASLENATRRESVSDTLRYQEESLLHLGHLGELMVAKFPFSPPKNDDRREDDYFNLPRLFGRAEATFFVRELPKENGGKDDELRTGNITIIVDGFNAPISAGNFIDLCQRGFYNRLPLAKEKVRSGSKEGEEVELVVGGRYKTGFVDPITGKQRRVPLEIMRAEAEGNKPFYGQARNTGLFTRAPPLLSYRTPRAVGLLHPEQDGNGANSEFFWLKNDARCVDAARGLDGKFTLIGYVVGGGREDDLLPFLDEGFQVESVQVAWGYDHLVRSKVGLIDILLQGDDQ